jgi:hypothetical protein
MQYEALSNMVPSGRRSESVQLHAMDHVAFIWMLMRDPAVPSNV